MRTCNCNPDRDPSDLQCGRAQSRDGVDSNFVCKRARYHEWMRRITINPVVKIVKCTDALMWYAGRIGEMVTITGVDDNSLWSRASGFANIIRFTDVEWVELKTPVNVTPKPKITGSRAEVILLDDMGTAKVKAPRPPMQFPLNITMEGERIKELEAEIAKLKRFHTNQAATILEYQEKMERIGNLTQSIQELTK